MYLQNLDSGHYTEVLAVFFAGSAKFYSDNNRLGSWFGFAFHAKCGISAANVSSLTEQDF